MSPLGRIAILAITLSVLIVGFVVLRPTDDRSTRSGASSTVASTPTSTGTSPPPPSATTPSRPARPEPRPSGPRIAVRDLQPVGGVAKIRARKGDRVRFTVTSDRGETVHLHGYDIVEPVAPGRAARFAFDADLEGIFEVELENSAVPVAEVRVDP